ncbi:MAG: L-threonylcarbamoyladenylate synthase [Proteobacteria bacterium]|nr:L-threonylcarbamoyladenylate synthase [Pseudomonadota bacterium]MCP4916929.1 L-threonylcarbamoyladenylate synthase [Pseudomonadota bacterium]
MTGLAQAIAALKRPGAVVLYPTATVYGLGGRASDDASAARIAALKGRAGGSLIVLVGEVPAGLSSDARVLAEALWPGPTTLIVEDLPGVCDAARGPSGTVALRWSAHPVCQSLVQAVGPITSTSANRHGEPPWVRVRPGLEVDAVVDAGRLADADPSTLVHVAERRILRRGATAERVEALLAALPDRR